MTDSKHVPRSISRRVLDYLSRIDITIFMSITIFGVLFFFRYYAASVFPLDLVEILAIAVFIPLMISLVSHRTKANLQLDERIAVAESKVDAAPEKTKPAWDLARVTLEAYFNRNLSQINSIFWLSVSVMIVGFGIIIWGISQAIQLPDALVPAAIASAAGVITEFIGATFLFIYRSTIQQASDYSKTLERMNSVGMAMQILDTIPRNAKADSLKDSTKAAVVRTLMQQAYEIEEGESTITPGVSEIGAGEQAP